MNTRRKEGRRREGEREGGREGGKRGLNDRLGDSQWAALSCPWKQETDDGNGHFQIIVLEPGSYREWKLNQSSVYHT